MSNSFFQDDAESQEKPSKKAPHRHTQRMRKRLAELPAVMEEREKDFNKAEKNSDKLAKQEWKEELLSGIYCKRRTSKLTPQLVDKFARAMAYGFNPQEALAICGITETQLTYYAKVAETERDDETAQLCRKIMYICKNGDMLGRFRLLDIIAQIGDGTYERKGNFPALMTLLERTRPELYAQASRNMNTNVNVDASAKDALERAEEIVRQSAPLESETIVVIPPAIGEDMVPVPSEGQRGDH